MQVAQGEEGADAMKSVRVQTRMQRREGSISGGGAHDDGGSRKEEEQSLRTDTGAKQTGIISEQIPFVV
jgi:hypothetical protein